MSPEMADMYLHHIQVKEYKGVQVTYATDYYSLGILMLEMLGRPFGGYCKDDKEDYLKKRIEGDLRIEDTGLIYDLIRLLTHKDPTQRYSQGQKVREHPVFSDEEREIAKLLVFEKG